MSFAAHMRDDITIVMGASVSNAIFSAPQPRTMHARLPSATPRYFICIEPASTLARHAMSIHAVPLLRCCFQKMIILVMT